MAAQITALFRYRARNHGLNTLLTYFTWKYKDCRVGLILTPAFKHRDEVQAFLTHQEEEDTQILADDKWVVKLAHP